MLVIVQFPLVDARAFFGVDYLRLPPWGALNAEKHSLFGFGGAMQQADFDKVPTVWRDDAQYIGSQWALRLRGDPVQLISIPHKKRAKEHFFWAYKAPGPKTNFYFSPAFRRLHSDGTIARLDVGFWVFGQGECNVANLVNDLLSLQTEVGHHAPLRTTDELGNQGKALADLYCQSTHRNPGVSGGNDAGLVMACPPAIFIDDRMKVGRLNGDPDWLEGVGLRIGSPVLTDFPAESTVVSDQTAGFLNLAYMEHDRNKRKYGLWMIRGKPAVSRKVAAASEGLRPSLLRLHSIRQGLIQLQQLTLTHPPINPGGTVDVKSVQEYMEKQACYALKRDNKDRELQHIVSLYDCCDGGAQNNSLKNQIKSLSSRYLAIQMLRMRLNSYRGNGPGAQTTASNSTPINNNANDHFVAPGEALSITSEVSNNLDVAKTNEKKVKDKRLKAALVDLIKQIEILVNQSGDLKVNRFVSRKLRQLSREVIEEYPNVNSMRVSLNALISVGGGLVAKLAKRITDAVNRVLCAKRLNLVR